MGEGATNQTGAFGSRCQRGDHQALGSIGGANASGALAKGGINNQMWNNAGGFARQPRFSAFLPGGGGIKSILGGKGGF
jgi:hypothetical protein